MPAAAGPEDIRSSAAEGDSFAVLGRPFHFRVRSPIPLDRMATGAGARRSGAC